MNNNGVVLPSEENDEDKWAKDRRGELMRTLIGQSKVKGKVHARSSTQLSRQKDSEGVKAEKILRVEIVFYARTIMAVGINQLWVSYSASMR